MNIKTKTVEAKAGGNGSISGYASTWTREPDSYGDVVAKGAFAESIAAIAESGKAIPLLWNHNSGDLRAYIGSEPGSKFAPPPRLSKVHARAGARAPAERGSAVARVSDAPRIRAAGR